MAHMVKILTCKNKTGQYIETENLCGRIRNDIRGTPENKIAVEFDEIKNKRSSYGCFYYNLDEVEFLNTEDFNMQNKLLDGYKVAMVKFIDGYSNKEYSYAIYDNANIGQLVLCDNNNIAEIVDIFDLDECTQKHATRPTKQIKCVIDDSAYKARVEKANRKIDLKKKMDERISQLQSEQFYAMFAEKDESLANLLAEYKEL